MGKRNAEAKLVDNITEASAPGSFKFWKRYGDDAIGGLHFKCPCGCGEIYGAGFPGWTWDGDREKPTLSPSLGCNAKNETSTRGADGYHWHGYLRNGVFEEC